MKKTRQQESAETQKYIAFLEKAVASENFKNNDPERYKESQEKLKKARFRLRLLQK